MFGDLLERESDCCCEAALEADRLVVDGLEALAVGDGELFGRLLRETDKLPLAPVLSEPDTRELPYTLEFAIGEYAATRIGVTAVDDPHPGSNANTGSESDSTTPTADLSLHRRLGSLPAAERYLEREHAGKNPAGRLCWLRTDQRGWLGGASDAQLDAQPAVVPQWPAPRHAAETVAEAITRSLDQYGIVADHLPEEKKDETRERIRTHERCR